MRTMTTINWVREPLTKADGTHLGTIHSGSRGSWSFRITTPLGKAPTLRGMGADGRIVTQEHRSLKAAKNAALALLHPSEAMGWGAGSGVVLYRAQWDSLIFAVFATAADGMAFQWRNDETGYRSDVHPVSGIREGRELASAVLRDSFPGETPADRPQAADGPLVALGLALSAAGIDYTPQQLTTAADSLALSIRRS